MPHIPYTFLWLLSRETRRGSTVLDAGCGRGHLVAKLRRPSQTFFGIEIDPVKAIQARNGQAYQAVVIGSVDALPFRKGSFDLAICTEVLEHLPEPEGVGLLRELRRVVTRKIVVTTPNGAGEEPEEAAHDPNQVHEAEWGVEDLERAGFKVRGIGAAWAWGVSGYARRSGAIGVAARLSAATVSAAYWRAPRRAAGLMAIDRIEWSERVSDAGIEAQERG